MKIYISIPISNRDLAAQQATARDIADKLRELGHEPVNPLDTPEAPKGLSEKEQYAYYMGEDMKQLLTCDAVYLCKHWNESRGCQTEQSAARINGIKIFYCSPMMEIPKAVRYK